MAERLNSSAVSVPTKAPPLLGDSHGCYRVQIVGNSGTGKSTAGQKLATMLNVPYIALDRLNWQPGWKSTPREEFQQKIREACGQSDRGWVVDGNYTSQGGTIVTGQATDIIWLDPPLLLYFPRIFGRTLARLFGFGRPCSPGCEETFRSVFLDKDSILWWCLTHHWSVRRGRGTLMSEIGIGVGRDIARRRMRRIGGWGGELSEWFEAVKSMLHQN